jgi:hypothetical protein
MSYTAGFVALTGKLGAKRVIYPRAALRWRAEIYVNLFVQRRAMMAEQLEVTVNLTNRKVQFTGVSRSNPDHPITFDYNPHLGMVRVIRALNYCS